MPPKPAYIRTQSRYSLSQIYMLVMEPGFLFYPFAPLLPGQMAVRRRYSAARTGTVRYVSALQGGQLGLFDGATG